MLPSLLFGLLVAGDVTLALLEANSIPFLSRDSGLLLIGLFALAGLPAAAGFQVLTRVVEATPLARRLAPASVAAGLLAGGLAAALAVAVGLASVSPETGARRHLSLAIFLLVVGLASRLPRSAPRLTLLGGALCAFLVAVSAALALGRLSLLPTTLRPDDAIRIVGRPHPAKIILVGVDGLCWETLQRWRSAEPNADYHWLEERAYVGPLKTITPTDSPRIWTSIITGTRAEDHGVLGFTAWEVAGLSRALVDIPSFAGAFFWLPASEWLGLARQRPISALEMRRPPVWEIVGAPGRTADVVAWWATWPALPLHGRLVSDKFYFWRDQARHHDRADGPAIRNEALTFPPEEAARLSSLRISPEQMTVEQIRSFIDIPGEVARDLATRRYHHHDVLSELPLAFTMDETNYAISEAFLRDGPAALSAFYFRGVDIVSHSAMRYSKLYRSDRVNEREDRGRYGDLVSRYYAYTFSRVRRLTQAAGANALVLVTSDHGFEPVEGGNFNHPNAPDGVILAMGAGKADSRSAIRAGIYDVAPTLLWLMGYPVARDMPGRPLRELFPLVEGPPQARCSSYGSRKPVLALRRDDQRQSDEEMLELLRTLGYVN